VAQTTIRPERDGDAPGIRRVLVAAFDTTAEADLVDAIRASGAPQIALVAELDGQILGQILFSEAAIGAATIAALAPMSVLPEHQRTGIGGALVRAGIEACRAAGYPGIVVLGHADYYPRFGFSAARAFGIECPYEVDDPHWMALELQPNALHEIRGRVEYHEAFANL
jgi:putative acetyltransferase